MQPVLRFKKDSPVGKAVFACAHGDNTVALALMLWQPVRDQTTTGGGGQGGEGGATYAGCYKNTCKDGCGVPVVWGSGAQALLAALPAATWQRG
jgi:hypothetical protein